MLVIMQRLWRTQVSKKKWYKFIFKQNQPIHIGIGGYGITNETRIFIPGWTMWGALTKSYNLNLGNDLSKNQVLFENISCFYPCFNKNGDNVLFPKFKDGELYFGNYSESKFRMMFVDTFVSTAVIPGSRAAKEESLHELDILLPASKVDFAKQEKRDIYWTGILMLENIDLLEMGFKIYIGGDVRYGFGELELIDKSEITNEELNIWNVDKNGKLKFGEEDFITKNYIEYIPGIKFEGKLELILDIIFTENGPNIKSEKLFIVPGSKAVIDSNGYVLKRGKFIKN